MCSDHNELATRWARAAVDISERLGASPGFRVPEGVGGEDDVERVIRHPVSSSGGVEDRRVGAPCAGDGAAARGMVACDVVGEGVDEAVVWVVRGGDEDVGVGFGDEDAGQACACAELEDVQGVWC